MNESSACLVYTHQDPVTHIHVKQAIIGSDYGLLLVGPNGNEMQYNSNRYINIFIQVNVLMYLTISAKWWPGFLTPNVLKYHKTVSSTCCRIAHHLSHHQACSLHRFRLFNFQICCVMKYVKEPYCLTISLKLKSYWQYRLCKSIASLSMPRNIALISWLTMKTLFHSIALLYGKSIDLSVQH